MGQIPQRRRWNARAAVKPWICSAAVVHIANLGERERSFTVRGYAVLTTSKDRTRVHACFGKRLLNSEIWRIYKIPCASGVHVLCELINSFRVKFQHGQAIPRWERSAIDYYVSLSMVSLLLIKMRGLLEHEISKAVVVV